MISLRDYLSCFTITSNYHDAKRIVDKFEREHARIVKALDDCDFRLGSVMSEKGLQSLRNVGVLEYGIGIRSCDPHMKGGYRDLLLSDVIDYLVRNGVRSEEQAIRLFERTKGIAKNGKIIEECKEYIFPYLKYV